MAATNRDLQQEVAAGRFREDLYYRLNVVSIVTLPLRERRDDIPGLAQGFLNDLTLQGLPRRTLSPGALEALQDFAWPGNVRQLKNFLEQAVIASDAELLTLPFVQSLLAQAGGCGRACAAAQVAPGIDTPLPDQLLRPHQLPRPDQLAEDNAHWSTLAKLERDHLVYTLEHTYYNQSAAARLVGISRQALIRLIKKFNLEVPDLPGKPSRKQ